MKYLWTEDTGAGLHFWQLVNHLLFDDEIIVESKGSNQGILDAVFNIDIKENDLYYIAFDNVVDNQDVRNKYRLLKRFASQSNNQIVLLDMICFEYFILSFDGLIQWTGTGKKDKIEIRQEILAVIENDRIDLSKIQNKKTLQYVGGFKRYSTERIIKALTTELTENEKWSVNGAFMGECWYKNCCVSEHPNSLRCGEPEERDGNRKIRTLLQSAIIQKTLECMI